MNIFAWITLLIFIVYFAAIYGASKSGWLERHNMSLAMGFIVMWRTQRGKEMIESLAGRATEADKIRERITEIEADMEEEDTSLAEARADEEMVEVVREYRVKAASLPALEAKLREASQTDDPNADALQESVNELRYDLRSLDKRIDPKSKFRDMLREGDDGAVNEELEELLESAQVRQEDISEAMSSQRIQISDMKEEISVLERSPENEKQMRSTRRRQRFWRGYGTVAIGIVAVFMFLMLALLVWQSFIVVQIPPGVIKPQQMLGIPGVNPVIPLWYGIFGLAVAMLVHEFAHGILTRAGKMTVKSLGLLYLVVPIGAFVEPDEEQLAHVDRGRRSRVFAVGPATNIIVAFLVVAIFAWGFMDNLEQAEEGVVLNYIIDEQTVELEDGTEARLKTPASTAGMQPWCTLMAIESLTDPPLGADGQNLSVIRTNQDFLDTMGRSQGGQEVRVYWYWSDSHYDASVILWDKGEVYGDDYSGQGYLGAGSYLIYEVPAGEYPDAMAHPMSYVDDATSFRNMTFFYISLPFTNPSLQPPPPGVTQAFEVTGSMAVIGDTLFWVIANLLYWIFWLNIMVGIFNALPAIPLDGGYIFRDGISWMLEKLRPTRQASEVDITATKVTVALSVLILFLILWQFIGPWVGAAAGL